MKAWRSLLTAALVAVLVPLSAGPAWAAQPPNDVFSGATPVGVSFAETLDTTEATTDADDESINQSCGAPATDASVWYAYTQATSGGVVVDVSGSSYTAGVLVATGGPASFGLVTCGARAVNFFALAGETYYILAIDHQFDGGGNGGLLRISFSEAPPPPTTEINVDPIGYVNKDGSATLSGSYTCTNAQSVILFADLSQPVGRFTIRGSFTLFLPEAECNGASQEWAAEVLPSDGKFAGGKSAAVALSFACGPWQCAQGYAEQQVQLRRGLPK